MQAIACMSIAKEPEETRRVVELQIINAFVRNAQDACYMAYGKP
jgi:hypothetical protein